MTDIFANNVTVPFINGCDNTFHPCQALADVMSIYEKYGTYKAKILYIGCKNNVFNSLIELVAKMGGTVYGLTPLVNDMGVDDSFYEDIKKTGSYVEVPADAPIEEVKKIAKEVHALYTDTWLDMEFFNNPEYADKKKEICAKMLPYQINEELIADTEEQLPAITYWLMGSLASIKPEDLLFLFIPILAGLIPLFLLKWRLNLLTIEEETSKSVGINVTALRFVVIICATLITAASVSVAGMIGWIGLVIPHFCRMIFGYDYRKLIPATALFGATFLLVVDDIARLATTREIPIWILTSFVGAPLFIYLLLTGGGRKRD